MFKKYQDWLYLPILWWTKNETLIYFKIVPKVFNTLIPGNFLWVEVPLKFLFRHDVKLPHYISFNNFHIFKSLGWIFSLGKEKKLHVTVLVNIKAVALAQCCILLKKITDQKILRIVTDLSWLFDRLDVKIRPHLFN